MSSPVAAAAQRGVLSLLGRHAVLFPVNFVAGVLLARLLGPADFGTYAAIATIVMGVGVLLDVGLGAILIQQADEPSPAQLRSVFTAQLLVMGAAAAALCLAAPWLSAAFKLPADGDWLIRAMGLHMLIGTLGTNSTLLLERRLRFGAFARLDVLNVLLDRGVTLALAASGWGVWSFLVGSLVAMAVRVPLLFALAPWPVGFALDRSVLKRALGFGATLQATNLTSLARDNMNALLGGPLFGPQAVGLLNWGHNLAQTCSHTFVQIVGRVSFPALARLHDDPPARRHMLLESMRGLNLAVFPVLAIVACLGDPIVTHVYGEAWRAALPALYAFALRLALTPTPSLLVGYLNATNRAGLSLRVTTVWTIVEWAIALALLPFFGFYGVAMAYAVGAGLPVIWLLFALRAELALPYGRVYGAPLLVAALGAGLATLLAPAATGLLPLIGVLAASAALAAAAVAWLERERLTRWARSRRPALAPLEDAA